MKFLICQIPLQLTSEPYVIENLEDHIKLKKKCIEHGIKNKVDVIIFPEYSYHPNEYEYLIEKSKYVSIFAGSYQDPNNFNQNMIFIEGHVLSQAKVNLSPFENSVCSLKKVIPSCKSLGLIPIINPKSGDIIPTLPLVCFDYLKYYHNQGKDFSYVIKNDGIQLVISQCCNDNPNTFFEAAQYHHNYVGFTSIICNISTLIVDGEILIKKGESAIFGLHSKGYLGSNYKKLVDSKFSNMMLKLDDSDLVCEIDLQIPYIPQVRSVSDDFIHNPTNIQITKISDLT